MLSEEVRRAAVDRATAQAAIDRLTHSFQEGTHHLMADQRRAVDAAGESVVLCV